MFSKANASPRRDPLLAKAKPYQSLQWHPARVNSPYHPGTIYTPSSLYPYITVTVTSTNIEYLENLFLKVSTILRRLKISILVNKKK